MKLAALLEEIAPLTVNGVAVAGTSTADRVARIGADPDIGSLHSRAQNVRPGGLFIAIRGFAADGHDYIATALENGAAAVVCQKAPAALFPVPVVTVADSRSALAALADRFYDRPSQQMVIIGITGTNGKTTTSYLVEGVLQAAGFATGVIGTVNYRYAGEVFENPVTTPESLDLQRILDRMRAAGVTHVVLEVSSHALDLHRVDRCWMDVGVFTSFSQDHLDYHATMAAYWGCKKRLFTEILRSGPKRGKTVAVVNTDDPKGAELLGLEGLRTLAVGTTAGNALRLEISEQNLAGMSGRIHLPAGTIAFRSALVGRYNAENILCAAGVGAALGLAPEIVKAGIEAVNRIPGRLEPIPNDGDRFVYVDYAHTPDALENVLAALKALTRRRILCVFGCGGDRDRGKRPLMGEIACRYSDLAVVTSDNPRSEPPEQIIAEILRGAAGAGGRAYTAGEAADPGIGKGFVVEPDRRAAIRLAVQASRPGETVLIAGKGHETYQILGRDRIHFDDREEARAALEGLAAVAANPGRPAGAPLPWTVADCLAATGGTLLGADTGQRFEGVAIDSRMIQAQELFVAIRGDVHDGHRFAADVLDKGVRGLVVAAARVPELGCENWIRRGVVCIAVSDTIRALGDMAAYHRRRNGASVVAITGSNGKTTTRQMTAAVVSRRHTTLSTRKNFNNDIGLPLTLFDLTPAHRWAVVEMGMNAPGEIRRLAEIGRPDIGVITNIAPAHLEGVGSIEGVMNAKGELLEGIAPDGTAVLNADDPRVLQLAQRTDRRVLLYGLSPSAAVRAIDPTPSRRGTRFTLVLPDTQVAVDLKVPGMFMIANALAAAAVGHLVGIPAAEIGRGLETFEPVGGRMTLVATRKGITLIDDTYNANPGSMAAALETLKTMRGDHRSVLVMGDMKELGRHAEELHRQVGALAARAGVSALFVTGEFARVVAEGAAAEGLPAERIVAGSKADLLRRLTVELEPGDWVLIKGSRSMAMEEVAQPLKRWADGLPAEPNGGIGG